VATPMDDKPRAVLFDLDGTLLDTAPDLVASLDELRAETGHAAVLPDRLTHAMASGSPALIQNSYGLRQDDPAFETLQDRFLAIYRRRLAEATRPYPGITALLDDLDMAGLGWGVVTNKPRWLTQPLLEGLNLAERAGCIIAGDDMPRAKPDPAGIRLACQQLGVTPADTVMVGDHDRDIEAGHRAGTRTLVALFGYISAANRVTRWGADGLIGSADQIRHWLAPMAGNSLNASA